MTTLVLLLVLASAAGAGAGVAVVISVLHHAARMEAPGLEAGLARMRAEVHTGAERAAVGLVRELELPRSADDVPYGAFYIEMLPGAGIRVRSRSAIDRGFVGSVVMARGRGCTDVTYSILRLPGDEALHDAVLSFELDLVGALRRIDPASSVRLSSTAFRELNRLPLPAEWEERPGQWFPAPG